MDYTENRGRMEGYLRGYSDKLAYFGDSSWDSARGATRSKGSNIFDSAYKGVGTDHRATRPSSYINKLRTQQRDLQRERDRFTTGKPVRNPYGTMSVSYGQAKNRQTKVGPKQPRLKPTYQSSSSDTAGSRWEITTKADQIAMWGRTGGRRDPWMEEKRMELGLSPNDVVFTPEQRKALMHLANTEQTPLYELEKGVVRPSEVAKDLLQSRGIQEVNPVAKHKFLTDDQKRAVRYLYNKDPNDKRIRKLMDRYGLQATEGAQRAESALILSEQKKRDQAVAKQKQERIAIRGKIDKYVSGTPLTTLRDDYNRLSRAAKKAYKAGKLKKDDPSIARLRYMRQAIVDKHRKEIYRSRLSQQDIA